MAERRQLRGDARAAQPQLFVLAGRPVRRPEEWCDHEASGPSPQQPFERCPYTVVER
jgi:hypothetical protein